MENTLEKPAAVPPSAVASGRLHVLHADSLDELDLWQQPWTELARGLDSPMAQFEWTRACLTAFSAEVPRAIAVARDGKFLAVAPLVKRRLRGVRRLLLAGLSEIHEPMDLVWSDPQGLARLVKVLTRGAAPIFFERIDAESPSVKLLRRACRGRAVVIARPQATCPYITLDDTWLEPETHLNAGRRSDLRRARRKAEQQGQVTTEIHTPDLSELSSLLDTAFEVEANNWKGEAGTALMHDAHRAVFYRQHAEAACVAGTLRICFLRIGDRVAAMQLAIEQGGSLSLLKVGYDARYSNCSPGLLLMRDTIRYAVEAGLKSYEFLGRAESWTRVWTSTERAYVALRIYPFTVRGLAALSVDGTAAIYERWSRPRCK